MGATSDPRQPRGAVRTVPRAACRVPHSRGMDPLGALDAFKVDGPPLRRWEAVVLSELHHGESTVTAALWLFCSCTIAVGGLVSAVLGTLEFLGMAGRTGPRTWTSLAPWLLFVGAAVLVTASSTAGGAGS